MVNIKTKEGASLWIALLAAVIVAVGMWLFRAVWWLTLSVAGGVFVVMALAALFIIRKYVAYKLKPIYSIVLSRDVHTNEIFSELRDKRVENIGEELTAWADTNDKEIARLKEAEHFRKQYLGNVAHELKTPIALIQGYAEGLTEGMAEDAQSRDYYCEVIMDEADKMNKMVKQLLTLTALEFGNDTPSMTTFDITEMIRDFLNSASILFHQKDAHVDFEADGPLYVCADEFKTEEVLRNYLSNAMNHLDGARRIRVRAARTGESVTVWVYNTGNPIPQEDLPNLWTKFFKVDKARTRAYGGSGIGLSIVKAVQDAHHQICGVANVEDGVEFFFTLQAAREPGW